MAASAHTQRPRASRSRHSRLPLVHVGDELLLRLGLLDDDLDHLAELALDGGDVVAGLLDDLEAVVGDGLGGLAVRARRGDGREAEERLGVQRLERGQRLGVDREAGDAGRLLERPGVSAPPLGQLTGQRRRAGGSRGAWLSSVVEMWTVQSTA